MADIERTGFREALRATRRGTLRLGGGIFVAALGPIMGPALGLARNPAAARPATVSFRLKIGAGGIETNTIEADARPEPLAAFVAQYNAAHRVESLSNSLNPLLIDPDKTTRFVAALWRMPEATLGQLAGHDLRLDSDALKIQYAAPTGPKAFDAPFTLTIFEIKGRTMIAGTDAAIDPELARDRAIEARAMAEALDAQVRETQPDEPAAALAETIRARSLATRTWRMNAQFWADARPSDADAPTSLNDAMAAERAFAATTLKAAARR